MNTTGNEFGIKSGHFTPGKLAVENSGTFIQDVFKSDAILDKVHFVLMDSPEYEFLRTFFEGDIFGAGSNMDNVTASFEAGDRDSEIGVATMKMRAAEYRARFPLAHKYLRQNIEREGFENTVTSNALKASRKNLARLAWHSDTALADGTTYALQDGFLKLIQKVTVGDLSGIALLQAVYGQYDTEYLDNLANGDGAFYVTRSVYDEVKADLADRTTALGDAVLTTDGKVFINGIEVIHSVALNHADIEKAVVLTVKENLKYGIFEDIKIDIADDFDKGVKFFYPLVEVAFGIQVPKASVAYVKEIL